MYKIIFEDLSEFIGGDLENSKWNEIPNKPIKKIEYSLLEKTAILENYEAYNHLVERVEFILINNKPRINKILLMAKKNNTVYIFIFDLFTKEIYSEVHEFGKEYYGNFTTGWKLGILHQNPTYKIL